MPLLENKVVLITGAAQGIGEAGGRVFAAHGAKVVMTDIHEDQVCHHAKALCDQGVDALGLRLDVTDLMSVTLAIDEAVSRYGRIDGLFHNAMSAAYVNNHDNVVTELEDKVWHRIIDLTLTGTFHVMRSVGRQMLKHGSGSMVFTATVDAVIGQAGIDAYSAAKGGVVALVRSAAAGLSPRGIRINAVSPSFVTTPDQAAFLEDPQTRARFDEMHLMQIAEPEDIAEYAAFLLSDKARVVTGTNNMVDSGYSSFKGKLDVREHVSSQ